MKQYNRSLDHTTLALACGRNSQKAKAAGNVELAAKYMLKAASHFANAVAAPDVLRAVAVLEASNKEAWAAQQARVTAASKPKKSTVAEAEEFDMGDDPDEVEGEDEDEDEMVEGAVEEDGEDDEDFDAQFAATLASLSKQKPRATAATKPVPKKTK